MLLRFAPGGVGGSTSVPTGGKRITAAARPSRQRGPCWPGDVTGSTSCNCAKPTFTKGVPTSICILFALPYCTPHLSAIHYAALPLTGMVAAGAELGEGNGSHQCKIHDPRDDGTET